MRRHVGGPYGTKLIPAGTFPSLHRKVASPPYSGRTRPRPPRASPTSFMSSAFIVRVLTSVSYSAWSLPMLICWPCLVVRPAFMMKRFDGVWSLVPGPSRILGTGDEGQGTKDDAHDQFRPDRGHIRRGVSDDGGPTHRDGGNAGVGADRGPGGDGVCRVGHRLRRRGRG